MTADSSSSGAQSPTVASAGFAADIADKLDMGVRAGFLNGLHGVIVLRGGVTVLERYLPGEDRSWGQDLGRVEHGPTTLHDLRSVSKSVTSLLYGIALAENKVPPPHAKLLDCFPDVADLAQDAGRASWTVQHALDMVLGTAWNEDLPYSDPQNSEIAMEQADDRYRFILDRPLVAAPGSTWTYNGGCTALLGALIAKGTNTALEEYARRKLFDPLGISDFEWMRGRDGVPSPASGLRLNLRDLAKIGRLFLANGDWLGRRIIPAEWIEACSTPSVPIGDGRQYSRQWYVTEQPVPAAGGTRLCLSAIGNGGQRLLVSPSLDLVVAIFCGNYNAPDQWILPMLLIRNIVLANIERA